MSGPTRANITPGSNQRRSIGPGVQSTVSKPANFNNNPSNFDRSQPIGARPGIPNKPEIPNKPVQFQPNNVKNGPLGEKPQIPNKPEIPSKPTVQMQGAPPGQRPSIPSKPEIPTKPVQFQTNNPPTVSPQRTEEIQNQNGGNMGGGGGMKSPTQNKLRELSQANKSTANTSSAMKSMIANSNNISNEKALRSIIERFEKEFSWFSTGWMRENETKRDDFIQSLIPILTPQPTPQSASHNYNNNNNNNNNNHAQNNNVNNNVNNSNAQNTNVVATTSGEDQQQQAQSMGYLHMSIKEKWAKTDTNLSVAFTADRIKQINELTTPFQEEITSFIGVTYRMVNVQVNIFGAKIAPRKDSISVIIEKVISLIKRYIELVTEEGHSSVQLINDMRTKILDKITTTSFDGSVKEHIITAANQFHNPKYVNKLVIIKLNAILSRLRSLTVQIANIVASLDSETYIVDHKKILEMLSCIRLTTTALKKATNQLVTSTTLIELINQKAKEQSNVNNLQGKGQKKSIFSKISGAKDNNNTNALGVNFNSPDNIYNFNVNQPKLENWEEGAGTLNSLVLKLTSTESIDQYFMKSFITTYPSFTTAEILFSKLLERYFIPKTITPEERMQIQIRVCIVLKYWIENKIKDFDDALITQICEFIEQLKNDGHLDGAKMLKNVLDKYIEKVNEAAIIDIPKIEVFDVKWSPSDMLMNASEKDIAEQITLISWRMYKSIDVNELLQLAWTKRQTRHRSPNIKAFIKRFNNVSFWVATMILFHEKLKDRSKVFTKFIAIAMELRKLNNFDGLMYIISGLRNSAVDRLKFSKFTVNDQHITAFEEMADTMNPQQSWKSYREILRSAGTPAIPFMGVYLTDLTFIEDGNPDTYGDLINFNKRQMVYKVLQEVLLYQTTPYQIEPKEPLLSYLTQMPFLEENDLHSLSTQREPRGATIKDLL